MSILMGVYKKRVTKYKQLDQFSEDKYLRSKSFQSMKDQAEKLILKCEK